MRIDVDKIASAARHAVPHSRVVLGSTIPAVAGTVIAARVLDEKKTYNQLEDAHGRMRTVHAGDVVVGVLGAREALRGYSGVVPDKVRVGDHLHLLNLGGVIGRCTSANPEVGPPGRVEVLGSVLTFPELGERGAGVPSSILPGPVPLLQHLGALPPLILLAGTCMHAGKTAAACALVRALNARGLSVGAAKLTGVALRRDTLEMEDHGAMVAYTFADAGLPSTCQGDVVGAAKGVLAAVASHRPDVIVAELGDGLLGRYGVMSILKDAEVVRATRALVLSANDPVAAWGAHTLLQPMGLTPAVFTGPATDNEAGSSAVRETTGVPAINARQEPHAFAAVVLESLGLSKSESLQAVASAK